MNQSLDGDVDHEEFAPSPALLSHFIDQVRGDGSVDGRRLYEVMRYWDEDCPEWSVEQRDFAAAWRSQPKWVVSAPSKSAAPRHTCRGWHRGGDTRSKAELVGGTLTGGPDPARSCNRPGLIDEYRLYFRPVALVAASDFSPAPAAAPPPASLIIGEGHDQVDIVSFLITQLARRSPTRQVRFGS